MTVLHERERTAVETPVRPTFTVATIVEVIGVVAAVVGAYMYYMPSGGVLPFLGWSWTVGDLATQWALGLMIGGGVFMTAGFATSADIFHRRHGWSTDAVTMAVLAVLALAGAVTYSLIWIF